MTFFTFHKWNYKTKTILQIVKLTSIEYAKSKTNL